LEASGRHRLDSAALAPLAWIDQLVWNHTSHALILLPWLVVYCLAWPIYEVLLVARYGQTLGKMACGVRIRDLNGGAVSMQHAVLRQIGLIFSVPYFAAIQAQNILAGNLANRALGEDSSYHAFLFILLAWTLLEIVTMLTNRKRRAVHDFIAHTVVVRENAQRPLFWWLLGLLALSFVVPELMEEKNLASRGRAE
jgi:uncharacterized RDD family membrane protein YckC